MRLKQSIVFGSDFRGWAKKKIDFQYIKKGDKKKFLFQKKNAGPDKKTRGAVDEELTTDGE